MAREMGERCVGTFSGGTPSSADGGLLSARAATRGPVPYRWRSAPLQPHTIVILGFWKDCKGKGKTGRGVQVAEALDQDEAGARSARRQLAVLGRAQVVRLAHAMPPRA